MQNDQQQGMSLQMPTSAGMGMDVNMGNMPESGMMNQDMSNGSDGREAKRARGMAG